jgi:hypothetical protein
MPNSADADLLTAILEGVEHARAEAERTWGYGRLELLVDDLWRAKLKAQKRKWSEAIQKAWDAPMVTRDMLAEVELQAGGMKRAWTKLGELATEAGHRPIQAWAWEIPLADGTAAVMVQTDAEVGKAVADAQALGRAVAVWTMADVANLIAALPELLRTAKVAWPDAKVMPQSPAGEFDVPRGDPLPFGDAA